MSRPEELLRELALPGTLPVLTGRLPALSPEVLDPLATEAVRELAAAGESENTLRSYQAALRYWAGWYQLRYGRALDLPVPTAAALQFIVDHAQRPGPGGALVIGLPPAVDTALVSAGLKGKEGAPALSTLDHRLSVLSKLHRLRGLANPCMAAEVRELMRRVRRGYAKRGTAPKKAPALTREPLEAMLATCDESLTGLRDAALLLFAWGSGGRRRSEVAGARMEHLQRLSTGMVYTLPVSKTNQEGEDLEANDKPVVGRAAQALARWLDAARIVDGFIFRRIRRGGHVGPEGLSSAAVREIVVQRAKLAGLEDAFSAHSLRSGFVTEAARQGKTLPEAMAMSGHRSLETFRSYFRDDPLKNGAATLLDS